MTQLRKPKLACHLLFGNGLGERPLIAVLRYVAVTITSKAKLAAGRHLVLIHDPANGPWKDRTTRSVYDDLGHSDLATERLVARLPRNGT